MYIPAQAAYETSAVITTQEEADSIRHCTTHLRNLKINASKPITLSGVEDIQDIMNKNAKLSLAITRSIGERLMNVERKMESLIFKDARTRIIDLLKQMADKYGVKVGDEILLKHDLTHQDFANLTATSRQTVTVTLNELRDKDLIYMERKKILILITRYLKFLEKRD